MWGMVGEVAILKSAVQVDFTEKVEVEQKMEDSEKFQHVCIWGKSCPGRVNMQCKDTGYSRHSKGANVMT